MAARVVASNLFDWGEVMDILLSAIAIAIVFTILDSVFNDRNH